MMKKAALIILIPITFLFIFCVIYIPPLPDNHGKVDAQLFLGKGEKQPLIVAFGGSEGGMLFSQESAKAFREDILSKGYALLTIGYIGTANTRKEIDRISLDAIYDTICAYRNHPLINGQKVAVLGVSRGGELVLNLAAGYNDFDAVISIVPSNISLPFRFNKTGLFETSSWILNSEEIPCISSTHKTRELLKNEGLYKTLSEILKDEKSVDKAEIPVEEMHCPVLIISAKNDEVWPSTIMSERIAERLKDNGFSHYYKHIAIDGGHGDYLQNPNIIIDFLQEHIKADKPAADSGDSY